jgi:hypothetical protein
MNNASKLSLNPFFIVLFVGLAVVTGYFILRDNFGGGTINSFDDCKAAGNPIMESFPEQCSAGGRTFVNTTQLSQ